MWSKKSRPSPTETWNPRSEELARRMSRPQRHRLLQGYPMAPAIGELEPGAETWPAELLESTSERPMIVGVLPHTFCNPSVEGCGFCTFPHERFTRRGAEDTVSAVVREIEQVTRTHDSLRERSVEAVYLGGGTANLATPEDIQAIGEALGQSFELEQAEYTLEGAPIYFQTRSFEHLHRLAALPARQPRISMGVQTFDIDWLERMGRAAIGSPDHVESVVKKAQSLGITTSVDLLFDLPDQPRQAMLEDVRHAASLGLDQICIYHLVLFHGLGTAWSQDAELVAQTPSMPESCENWLALREELYALGYRQSTLTNFERAEVQTSPRRFLYEPCSFAPETYDGLGFGPGAISTFSQGAQQGVKTLNASTSEAYRARVDLSGHGATRRFDYETPDLRLLHVTRQLARGRICQSTYRARFGTTLQDDFGLQLEALSEEGLLTLDPVELRLTPRGMFYADSVAGLLAADRIRALFPERRDPNRAIRHHMG